jgi:hypothetical protein
MLNQQFYFSHFRSGTTKARCQQQITVIATSTAFSTFTQTEFLIGYSFTDMLIQKGRMTYSLADILPALKDRAQLAKEHGG